ncbi:MAG: alpha-amylase/4-alpha-glucanotransferase domain-containing protein [Helicobacteraceae bacterium]
MKPVSFLLGLHSHQPVDNFDAVVRKAIELCYKPFFLKLAEYKGLRLSVHFSGYLLEFIKQHDRRLFTTLQDLSHSGAIEFLTGGFYEPILCAIPSQNRKNQIKKLSAYIQDNFGQDPKGLWLTERVWDNAILKDLTDLGIEYVVVDDYHFLQSGVSADKLFGYYHTSADGKILKLFPINEHLRYILPFESVETVENYLLSLADKDTSRAAVIFDDGEKFGLWPGTHEWIYQNGWLDEFFTMLSGSQRIQAMCYKDYIEQNKPLGFVYLKENSYMEMGQWSLDAASYESFEASAQRLESKQFLRGGIWKDFLLKYYEAGKIHKRSLYLNGLKVANYPAHDLIMRTEFNDVLWHGVFGGLYLPNLRDVFYKYVYKAEEHLEVISGAVDINQDGYDEIRLDSQDLVAIFDTKQGGQLIELGVKDKFFNLQNTLTRRREGYHAKFIISDEPQEKLDGEPKTIHAERVLISTEDAKNLSYDWYIKNSFIDHISDASFTLENFVKTAFKEHADFVNKPYSYELSGGVLREFRDGGIYLEQGVFPTKVQKTFSLDGGKLKLGAEISSTYKEPLCYALELNFHFAEYENVTINGEPCLQDLSFSGIDEIVIKDTFLSKTLRVKTSAPFEFLSFALKTVSQSESGVDLTVQGVSMAFKFRLQETLNLSGSLEVRGE